jgi:hypothetical protein
MNDTPTPGQRAYEAFCESRDPWAYTAFRHLPAAQQRDWEAVAQAVLDHAAFPPLDLRLEDR